MKLRDATRVKNPGGQVVMRHAAARRRRPAAPSDLPKSGGAAAPPAPPLVASLIMVIKNLTSLFPLIFLSKHINLYALGRLKRLDF